MKRLLLHLGIIAVAAAAGWSAGSRPAVADTAAKEPRLPTPPRSLVGTSTSSWESKIPGVRASAAGISEAAWVKWAFAIPDADVPAAVAKLNPKSDFHALRCLYARWVKLDPQAAWASFRASAIPAVTEYFHMLTEETGVRGLGYSIMHSNPRSLIAGRMLASWIAVDPDAANAFAAKLAIPGSPEATSVSMHSRELWRVTGGNKNESENADQSATDLSDAATHALDLPEPGSRKKALESAVQKWMEKDPAAACQWIQELPPEQRQVLGFEQLRWAMRNAPAASRTEFLTSMLQERTPSAEDFAGVAGNSSKLYHEFSGTRQGLYNAAQAVREWTLQDPPAARKFVGALPDSDLKALIAGEAAGALVRSDANAAVALLNEVGGDQGIAIKGLMRGWMDTDVKASLQWAGTIGDAEIRDTSRGTVAETLAQTDPVLALETARTITDPAIRQRIHETISRSLSWNPTALSEIKARFPSDDWNSSAQRFR